MWIDLHFKEQEFRIGLFLLQPAQVIFWLKKPEPGAGQFQQGGYTKIYKPELHQFKKTEIRNKKIPWQKIIDRMTEDKNI